MTRALQVFCLGEVEDLVSGYTGYTPLHLMLRAGQVQSWLLQAP